MPLPYNVWTDEQINNRNVCVEGNYSFGIINAVQKTTKQKYNADNSPMPVHQMLEIDFIFKDQNGVIKQIKDWIVFIEGMDWKLKHLAQATGLEDFYNTKQLEDYHFKLKKGVFHIGVKDSIYNGEVRKQNFVKDYIGSQPANEKNPELNDDIPF